MMALRQFGERLRMLMDQRQETPQSIATQLDVTPQAVHKWMRGQGEITLPNLRSLARLLNVNWLWLRYGDSVVMELTTPKKALDPVEQYRQQLIEDLVENERRRRWAQELLGIGLFEINILTGERHWSCNFRRMLRIPLDMPATPENFAQVVLPETAAQLEAAVGRVLKERVRVFGQVKVGAAPHKLAEFMVEPMLDQEGRVSLVLGMVRFVDEGRPSLREMVVRGEGGE